jgi:Tfp pilus tip-associated adhesin PilY1
LNDSSEQSVYGVWDRGDSNKTRANLVEQTITPDTTGGIAVRTITDLNVSYTTDASSQYGWFFDLPTSKERVVVNPIAYGELLLVNSMIPQPPQLCDASGGDGWMMAIDIFNGGQPGFIPLDVNGDNVFDSSDSVGDNYSVGVRLGGIPTESKCVSGKCFTVDSNQNIDVQPVQGVPPGSPSRMSWTSL